MTPQLLDLHNCGNYFPSICMRPIPSRSPPPSQPRALGPASNSTKRMSKDEFGVMPIELGISVAIALGFMALLLLGAVVWRKFSSRSEGAHLGNESNARRDGDSVYAVRPGRGLQSKELTVVSADLVVEDEHGALTMQTIAAMVESRRIVLVLKPHNFYR
mmetsp:Transcript_43370/g.81297  ORF Transcript_43370/g.81297 Transcript_43370/m.81297 type:complete len:160 (+) Transcript_43370:3-482(+)